MRLCPSCVKVRFRFLQGNRRDQRGVKGCLRPCVRDCYETLCSDAAHRWCNFRVADHILLIQQPDTRGYGVTGQFDTREFNCAPEGRVGEHTESLSAGNLRKSRVLLASQEASYRYARSSYCDQLWYYHCPLDLRRAADLSRFDHPVAFCSIFQRLGSLDCLGSPPGSVPRAE